MPDLIAPSTRWLITLATLAYGLGPFVIDMNRTHLLHPAWPGHARFHLLWSAVSQLAVAGLALWLVWADTANAVWHCRLAVLIGLAMNTGFWGAFLFRRAYHGTLHDPQGIPPLGGKVDGNLLAVTLITALLLVALWQTWR
jgi:hypothetical protein